MALCGLGELARQAQGLGWLSVDLSSVGCSSQWRTDPEATEHLTSNETLKTAKDCLVAQSLPLGRLNQTDPLPVEVSQCWSPQLSWGRTPNKMYNDA